MSKKLRNLFFIISVCICCYILATCLIHSSFKQNKIIEGHKKNDDDAPLIPPLHPKLHKDYDLFEINKIHDHPNLSSICKGRLLCIYNILSYKNSLKKVMDRSHNNYT